MKLKDQPQLNAFLCDRYADDRLVRRRVAAKDVTELSRELDEKKMLSCATYRIRVRHGLCSTGCITEHNR